MKEIRCPNCQTIIPIDDSLYIEILKQVRDEQFELEKEKLEKLDQEKRKAQLSLMEKEYQTKLEKLSSQAEFEKLTLIQKQQSLLQKKEQEIEQLKSQRAIDLAKAELAFKEKIQDLENQKNQIETQKQELLLNMNQKLKDKDEMIEYYKDLKLRLSTKMLGETLEKHCENQFNQLRATGFKNSYFEKDNDVSSGSKGDYIFRELDEEGNELVSIMFEMKNEADQTTTKKTNESFFKELDKDRREKKCEYAILVSLLEPESELYNGGIVDVSYRYEKMYVIRPQFFIPMITILRNAALKNAQLKKELIEIRQQNIDVTHFEEKMMDFKDGFTKNVELASRKFQGAIDEIDKTISHLQKVRENLVASDRQLHLANKKVDNLSIRSLTYKNETMTKLFKKNKK
ncbi:DUF2130 domain-containing protein [Faecalicoccus acidiformans]|uniref:DUF2130 domain-containing protein n=1 Tax=Faecalicoccus acidiformans TaxID=915173 RepID=A0ABS2FPJ1_9FIRM|nr:DUF2130 domain-containing protein [Faecalicoccus acidiformans]MBM6831958.1 DUF2130 domain-containing protein [Faecalicoccus acidiformans]